MPGSVWTEVQPGDCIPFWPVQMAANKQMIACIKDTALETVPFSITESHSTFLQLYHDVSTKCTVAAYECNDASFLLLKQMYTVMNSNFLPVFGDTCSRMWNALNLHVGSEGYL